MKKILIITANYGTGHLIASKAIEQMIGNSNDVLLLDIVEKGGYIEKITSKFYIWMSKHSHFLWRLIYYNPITRLNIIKSILTSFINKKVYSILENYRPDIIISTHFLSTLYGAKYKLENKSTKLFVCITDYEVHPIWINNFVDMYFLPSEYSVKDLKSSNYMITGIPLRKGFLEEIDKNALRREFNIHTKNLIVLLNLGSNSVLPLRDAIKYIKMFSKKLYFLVIAGRNEKNYEKLQEVFIDLNTYDFKLFGFTEDIHKLMFLCDFSVAKAGGLNLTELIYTKTPAIYYKSLPGQEEGNERFIKEHGLGFIAKNFKQLVRYTEFIIQNPSVLNYFMSNLSYQKESMNFLKIKEMVSHETIAL
ncbi:MAG: hypothetical protein N2504_03400 [candidate division WOR-3 bacterium]|nr:hypothetical protein [candidate division WOR-3 bacterium]MCX7947615.1 hypothetical protein [candidate division WOR-3 bacterium]MDW8150375.1 hypothetical protein [candidate division WOR-3 bacterium]